MKFPASFTVVKNMTYIAIMVFVIIFIMNLVFKLLRNLLNKVPHGYEFICYLSAIGVAHHELSHALLHILTGSKVTNIVFFQKDSSDGTLGYVEYINRGPKFLQGVQSILGGLAPVFTGYVSLYLMMTLLRPYLLNHGMWYLMIPFYYVFVCIFIHCALSDTDLKNIRSGLKNPLSILMVIVIFYLVIFICHIFNYPLFLPVYKLFAQVRHLIMGIAGK